MAVVIPESVEQSDLEKVFNVEIGEPSNLFADEAPQEDAESEVEEEGTEADDEVEEGETESEKSDEEPSEEKEEDKKEEAEKPDVVAENLKKALHAERAKRKELAENAKRIQEQFAALNSEANGYKEAYEAIVNSIKEYGLEEVVKVPQMKALDPEVIEARKLKQQQESQENVKKFYDFVRSEATSLAPDFSEINLAIPEHGAALTQIITAAVVNGIEREVAVAEGMKVLNTIIANAKKEALKTRQPAVTPKAKPKARTKQSAPQSMDLNSPDGISKLFASMGKKFATGKGDA